MRATRSTLASERPRYAKGRRGLVGCVTGGSGDVPPACSEFVGGFRRL
jgi:hypothetical protein